MRLRVWDEWECEVGFGREVAGFIKVQCLYVYIFLGSPAPPPPPYALPPSRLNLKP